MEVRSASFACLLQADSSPRRVGTLPTGGFRQRCGGLCRRNRWFAGPSKAFLSKGGDGGYLKVSLPDTVESIGAMVTVTLDNGKRLYLPYVSGEGLCSDSSRILITGLGGGKATKVNVKFLDGSVNEKEGSFRNEMLKL